MDKPTPCPTHSRHHQAGCDECRRYAREKYHHRRTPTGAANTLHDIAPVRAHIRTLLDAGMRLADIAAAAGMNTAGHVSRLMYGTDKKACTLGTAHRILAITPQPVQAALMDGVGVRRRIRALVRAGWQQRVLAERLGYHPSVGSNWANTTQVHRATHDKVAALYDELSTLDGGSLRARRWAERRGWEPPEAWSDTSIDNPQAQPYDWTQTIVDEVAVRRALAGDMRWRNLTHADRVEVARRGNATGGRTALVKRLGVSASTLIEWAEHAGPAPKAPKEPRQVVPKPPKAARVVDHTARLAASNAAAAARAARTRAAVADLDAVGLTPTEIAALSGLSRRTVHRHLQKARDGSQGAGRQVAA